MLNRTILHQIKELYEQDGGWIISSIGKGGKGKKTVLLLGERYEDPEWNQWKKAVAEKGTLLVKTAEKEVFIEAAEKKDRVVICGAGYVGASLARLSVFAGIRTIVIEDRAYFAEKAREAGADLVLCGKFEEMLTNLQDEKNSAFVIMTRGHGFDQRCLMKVAEKQSYYVGMMGSKTRAAMMRQELKKQGISEEWVERLHTPIGLDIGAQTPEEIAVSVLAEIILERTKSGSGRKEGHEVFEKACTGLESNERFVLATILDRNGSAPRKEGTHFIVSEKGVSFGTIGGGKLEADVCKEAEKMLADGRERKILQADLNNMAAAEEGLVCGGNVRVLLELGRFS